MNQQDPSKRAVGKAEALALSNLYKDAAPTGKNITATLMAKSWGSPSELVCYFKSVDCQCFQITTFRTNGHEYRDNAGNVDFALTSSINRDYQLSIRKGLRDKAPTLVSAILLPQ